MQRVTGWQPDYLERILSRCELAALMGMGLRSHFATTWEVRDEPQNAEFLSFRLSIRPYSSILPQRLGSKAVLLRKRVMARYEKQGNKPDGWHDTQKGIETASVVPIERIQNRILLIRRRKVILDHDLADLYGVSTGRLNEQVKRNIERFPSDFAFRLSEEEFKGLISQFAISNVGRGGRRKLPYAFTEHGAIMAASVLNSPQAVQVSVFVVRAFVQLRRMLAPYKELMARLDRLEQAVGTHDEQIIAIVEAIRLLMPPEEESPKEPFGFRRAKKN
jgi:hypothetical protein